LNGTHASIIFIVDYHATDIMMAQLLDLTEKAYGSYIIYMQEYFKQKALKN